MAEDEVYVAGRPPRAIKVGELVARAEQAEARVAQLREDRDEWRERCRRLCDPGEGRWREVLNESREALRSSSPANEDQ